MNSCRVFLFLISIQLIGTTGFSSTGSNNCHRLLSTVEKTSEFENVTALSKTSDLGPSLSAKVPHGEVFDLSSISAQIYSRALRKDVSRQQAYDPKIRQIHTYWEITNKKLKLIRPGDSIFNFLSFEEVKTFASDEMHAKKIVAEFLRLASEDGNFNLKVFGYGSKDISLKYLSSYAKMILAYEYIVAWQKTDFYSTEQFKILAQTEGLKTSYQETAYRFDSRAPSEIRQAGGFVPNPKYILGSLIEHSIGGMGRFGAGFVSLSTLSGNEFNLKIGPVLLSVLATVESNRGHTYEYEVANIFTSTPDSATSILGEHEVVAAVVPFQKVTRYRKVEFEFSAVNKKWGIPEIEKISFGEWVEL